MDKRQLLEIIKNGENSGVEFKKDSIRPEQPAIYEEIQLSEGKSVAVITLTEGISKPYVLRDKGKEDIYICVVSTS